MTDEKNDLLGALSGNERAAVREQLRVYMREHPARIPVWIRFLQSFERSVYNPSLQFAAATLAILLVGGTGTAFAAQGALPGDALYGVKVNIEEPILGAFATSPEAQANWSAELASRRLSEAEQLAVLNKLTPERATTVSSGFDQAAETFDASVAQLSTSTSNAAAVATIASNMEATLAANTQVLNEISNAVPNTASALKPIIANVEERTVSLNSARTAMDVTAAQTNSDQVQLAAQTALGNAAAQITQAISNTADASSSAASSTASTQVAAAQAQYNSGKENLDQGNYIAALESLQAASVEARVVQLHVSLQSQLGTSTTLGSSTTDTSATFPLATTTSSVSNSTADSSSTAATSSISTDATSSPIHIFRKRTSN